MRFKADSEDTQEYPQTGRITEKDLKMAHCTTRQYWAEQEANEEALMDGGRQMVARRFAKEEADINNNQYRQLRSVSRHHYFEEEGHG
jgi:hypothetical protein